MNIEEKINSDLKEAMKAKDKVRVRGIRALKSAILLMKTDGSGQEITEEGFIKMVQKQIKQRQDSIDIYKEQGREELAQTEQEEIDVMQNYLPKQLSDDELESYIKNVIADTGASSMKDMGKVMGKANAELSGKAEGKRIAAMVKTILAS